MKIQDMLFREIGVLLGKVEVLGDNIELNLKKGKRKEDFDCSFRLPHF